MAVILAVQTFNDWTYNASLCMGGWIIFLNGCNATLEMAISEQNADLLTAWPAQCVMVQFFWDYLGFPPWKIVFLYFLECFVSEWEIWRQWIYLLGQRWTFGESILTNEAGLWKSEDTWNLMELQPELFNISAAKGESDMCSYVPNTQAGSINRLEFFIYCTKNSAVWKLLPCMWKTS